jgi:hypothetical protein
VPALHQPRDQRDHAGDMAGGHGLHLGRAAAEQLVAVGKGALVPFGQRPPGGALRRRDAQDLVVQVRDVSAVSDLVAGHLKPAHEDVETHRRTQMAEVWCPLNGRPAQIDRGPPGRDRLELAHDPAGCIVQAERHLEKPTVSNRVPLLLRHTSLTAEIVPIQD